MKPAQKQNTAIVFVIFIVSLITVNLHPQATPDKNTSIKKINNSLQNIKSDSSRNNRHEEISANGIVVDETQSKWGKDFYEYFYNIWPFPEKAEDYTIVVVEKPLPGLGTVLSIKFNDEEIFQQFAQPKLESIQEIAEYAAEYTLSYLQNYELIIRELQGNDMKGTGIY
jgi:curli production assembly/transport component CsgE